MTTYIPSSICSSLTPDYNLIFTSPLKKVIMKRITKRIKRLRDLSLWENGWAKTTGNDHKINFKNRVNQTGYFVFLFSCNSQHH